MCNIDESMNDPTGLVQSDVRHTGIQQIYNRFQGHLCLQQNIMICAAKYADLWPHFVS